MAIIRRIPNYIMASSPQGLRRLMLKNNIRMGSQIQYEIHFVNGKWYAWFNEEIAPSDKILTPSKEDKE